MSENRCIYCLQESTEAPPEHVIPEALGCPEQAILRKGEVCQACNNGLAHLDVALADSFDLARFFTNQPSKDGKPPTIAGRSNVATIVTNGEPILHINFGPGDVKLPDGRVLKAPTNKGNSMRGKITLDPDGKATIQGEAHAFQNPKFSRAIHKVALGIIAGMLGRQAALAASLNPAREFVLKGVGPKRTVLCRIPTTEWQYVHKAWRPYTSADGYCVVVTLCGYQFTVDCTPTQASLAQMVKLIATHDPQAKWLTLN
jgi:hypothetical protein